uniref:Uncharacterized protein n=1 Tax=Corethron hystrix TaxID=216773 RepID=A0A7S1FMG0_9STRA|mmetsp:Transcript_15902/g.35816  ORF Transcript_15902/g.35816 Transcript_15902/m.35816 type:complete len:471 (+) Transcript_15902:144-1556(+)
MGVHSNPMVKRRRAWCIYLGLIRLSLSLQASVGGDGNGVFLAAKEGNLRDLTDLIESDKKIINVQDDSGWTPLHIAAREGHASAVKYLLDSGANITVPTEDEFKLPPLMVGLKYLGAEHEVVGMLKDAVTEYVATLPRQTQAHVTAAAGNVETLKKLLEDDGDIVDRADDNGWTALHEATNRGQLNTVKLLVEHGSDITRETTHGWTPALLAKKNRNHDILDYFKDHEMKVRTKKVSKRRKRKNVKKVINLHHAAAIGDLQSVKKFIDTKKTNIDEADEHNWTALHEAAHNGHEEIVKYLVDSGADVNTHTHGGWSPILLAGNRHLEKNSEEDKAKDISILEYLLTNNQLIRRQESAYEGADKELVLMAHQAAQQNDVIFLRDLIKKNKLAAHALDEHGWAPLHEAARAGRLEVLELLVAEGVDINLRSNFERGGSAAFLAENFHGKEHPTVEYLKSVGGEVLEPYSEEL